MDNKMIGVMALAGAGVWWWSRQEDQMVNTVEGSAGTAIGEKTTNSTQTQVDEYYKELRNKLLTVSKDNAEIAAHDGMATKHLWWWYLKKINGIVSEPPIDSTFNDFDDTTYFSLDELIKRMKNRTLENGIVLDILGPQ